MSNYDELLQEWLQRKERKKAYRQKYYQENKEREKFISDKWKKTPKGKASLAKQAEKNKTEKREERNAMARDYYWTNREKFLDKNRKYHIEHKEERNADMRKRRKSLKKMQEEENLLKD